VIWRSTLRRFAFSVDYTNDIDGSGRAVTSVEGGNAMFRTTTTALTSEFFLSVILLAPAWGETTPAHAARPGSINYVEGEASIAGGPLTASAIGARELEPNQSIATQAGRVEILLTPGVFLRLADDSSVKMISPNLTSTEVRLERGRALVEVVDIHKENDIRIDQNGANTQLLRTGLYNFDADHNEVRVFKGSAQVTVGDRKVMLGGSQKVALGSAKPRASHIQSRQYQDGFYRWSRLRSAYLSEASVSAARSYIGDGPGPGPDTGWYGPGWSSWGWYWNPWFGVYTFLPQDGIFYGPFGWGFYSPIAVYWSPFAYFGNYPHRFGEFHYPYGHGLPPPIRRGGRRSL
jgi:hypothetical protein